MSCEKCGERDAQVRYTEYRDGESKKLMICFECAKSLGFEVDPVQDEPPGAPDPSAPVILVSASLQPAVKAVPEHERCPRCGLTSAEFQRLSRFGCAQCYEVFAPALDAWFEKIHGASSHRGRLPGTVEEPPASPAPSAANVAELQERLARAIENEDFEEAARLRDCLRAAHAPETPRGSRPEGKDH
jgi:protein arginine kinase activator